jgi:hypothetical protein
MHRLILFIVTVAVGLASSEGAGPPARADEAPVVRHKKVAGLATAPAAALMRPAARDAGSAARTGTRVIPSMVPTVLMGALDFGAPIPIAGGNAAGESSI